MIAVRDRRWRRRTESRADLSTHHAEHQAGGRGDADPRGRDTAIVRVTFGRTILTREGNDPGRLIELLEPAKNLGLLQGEPFRRKRGIRGLDAGGPHFVHPATEIDGAIGAEIAPIQMGRPVAGQERVDERAFGEMSADERAGQ